MLLNKADTIDTQQLMRVYGALMWSLGKVMQTPEVCRVYIGSFWEAPLSNFENRFLLEVRMYVRKGKGRVSVRVVCDGGTADKTGNPPPWAVLFLLFFRCEEACRRRRGRANANLSKILVQKKLL